MEKIVVERVEKYDVSKIKEFLSKGFSEISFNTLNNSKVLLKPNLLSGKPPEKAVTTHPAIIEAIAEVLSDYSCQIYIGDSPGYESTQKVLKNAGFMDVVKRHNLKISPFDKKIIKKTNGISPYREFTFGDDPEDYDLVFNIPKLKTHSMMGLTLGVKNTFGFIHSFEKAKWHLRAGKNSALFARMLIDIHLIARPSITILDGIIGMDGDGPSNGRVRDIGLVCISKDAFALDQHIERMIGLSDDLPITGEAAIHSLIKEHEIIEYGNPSIDDFLMPKTMDTDWNIPKAAKKILKNFFIKKPKLYKNACKGCGICSRVCPAGAIGEVEKRPAFDYSKCIRCYCCQEMCPEGAIRV